MQDQMKMKALAIVGAVALIACAIAGAFALMNAKPASNNSIAATVNGTAIYEDDVTAPIEQQRAQMGLGDSEKWGQFLQVNGLTPEDIRSQQIDSLVTQELVRQGASELGLAVDESEVDSYIESVKGRYESEEAFQAELTEAGLTEETLRQSVGDMLLQQAIVAHFQETAAANEEETAAAVQYYAQALDGAKRSSHILIRVDNATDENAKQDARREAQDILDQINSGAISFEDAAETYSADPRSAQNGGDVGWDRATSFVTAYQDALNELEVGQVSGIVESEFGFHIIKCTELYTAPENPTSIEQLPESLRADITSMLQQQAASTEYGDWIQALRDAADIVINDMPADVPYNVDMSAAEESANAAATGAGASGESSTGAPSEAAASSDSAASA